MTNKRVAVTTIVLIKVYNILNMYLARYNVIILQYTYRRLAEQRIVYEYLV